MQKIEINMDAYAILLEETARQLAHYSIGFVVPQSKNNTNDGTLGGSGTLVSIDGIEGVLTAEHVVRNLRSHETAGIILAEYGRSAVHQMVFKVGDCDDYSCGTPADQSAKGPDISFVVLPPAKTTTLKAKKSFHNLSKRRDLMLDQTPPRELGFWAINGLAEEWTQHAPDPTDFDRIKVFQGHLLGPLERLDWRTSGDFDYIDFEVRCDEGYGVPKSFDGYSGGGIWQVTIEPTDQSPKVTNRYLMGTAFYESGKEVRDGKTYRKVTCHGIESVYRKLIDRVRQRISC